MKAKKPTKGRNVEFSVFPHLRFTPEYRGLMLEFMKMPHYDALCALLTDRLEALNTDLVNNKDLTRIEHMDEIMTILNLLQSLPVEANNEQLPES